MIGKLTGIIDDIEEDHILLDVHDVVYIVYCPMARLRAIINKGDNITLYIFTYIREDAHKLYGFLTKEEKNWFFLLRNIQKVGPKHAMAILGQFTLEELSDIMVSQNVIRLTKAPGIGKTLAEKIIHELKNKIASLAFSFKKDSAILSQESETQPLLETNATCYQEVLSGLTNLGYSRMQAMQALQQVLQEQKEQEIGTDAAYNVAELLRSALKICANS